MGLFFTVYYAGMMVGPAFGGRYADWARTAGAAIDFGAIVLIACPFILWAYILRAVPRPPQRAS